MAVNTKTREPSDAENRSGKPRSFMKTLLALQADVRVRRAVWNADFQARLKTLRGPERAHAVWGIKLTPRDEIPEARWNSFHGSEFADAMKEGFCGEARFGSDSSLMCS